MSNPQEPSSVGRYRIQAVARMTGIPIAVLRAWEKRYGVPRPARSDKAYRLYTDDDVQMVRRLSELKQEGIAAAEAARIVQSENTLSTSVEPSFDSDSTYRLVDAALHLDATAIDHQLRAMVTEGNAADAFERVLAPALVAVGEGWRAGRLSEAHEHFLSEHVMRVLSTWLALVRPAAPKGTFMLGCYLDELHTIPALGLALRWASWGFLPIWFGARTPPSAFEAALRTVKPFVVALSLTMPASEPQKAALADYARVFGSVPWTIGGAGAESMRSLILELGGLLPPGNHAAMQPWLHTLAAGSGRLRRSRSNR